MGDDARDKALSEIEDKFIAHLEAEGMIETHSDLRTALSMSSAIAEFIHKREIGYQTILSAMMTGDFMITINHGTPMLEIPVGSIIRATVPIEIEEPPDKHVIRIRRKT